MPELEAAQKCFEVNSQLRITTDSASSLFGDNFSEELANLDQT
jgi:hypothetical protein